MSLNIAKHSLKDKMPTLPVKQKDRHEQRGMKFKERAVQTTQEGGPM